MSSLQNHITEFESIKLEEMNAIKLLNRLDTKYVFHQRKLPLILEDLKQHYKVLEIENSRILSYENHYFDTADYRFYNKHQRGMLNRTKIRIRKYVESNLSFIEIKRKTNKSRTVKKRIPLKTNEDIHSKRITDFVELNSNISVNDLKENLYINFQRITLASNDFEDRCTIDTNLIATWKGQQYSFDNLVIAELKQEKFKQNSKFNLALKKNKVYSESFSKYCFSFFNLNKDLKKNNFNKKIHQLNKILS